MTTLEKRRILRRIALAGEVIGLVLVGVGLSSDLRDLPYIYAGLGVVALSLMVRTGAFFCRRRANEAAGSTPTSRHL